MTLSVVIITRDEEANIGRTLASVSWAEERIVVDSGSTDRTRDIAGHHGARVFQEAWKGYSAQKNSAIAKATSDWVLSLDADEEVTPGLASEIMNIVRSADSADGYFIPRQNLFLGKWIRHGGFYPDPKLRLFRRGKGAFDQREVHETMTVKGNTSHLNGVLIHHAYPTLAGYISTMNQYSSLGAQSLRIRQPQRSSKSLPWFLANIFLRPLLTFFWNYIIRGGFLDGKEGLLLHLYHNVYVSWKYAKFWELQRAPASLNSGSGK
jgi:glycosyltransferase involved in cell wall biosynthesis